MVDTKAALIWCPCPDSDVARSIAKTLLAEKLIACANIMPVVESVFEWNGECSSAHEVGVLFKTLPLQLDRAIARLGQIHPYDTPAIVGWNCDDAHPATTAWLNETLEFV